MRLLHTLESLRIIINTHTHAHERNRPQVRLLHRDLSSRNLLLTANNSVKIADFGTVRKMKSDKYLASTISGSPPWMSPEQVSGIPLSLKSDVFSLGSILWEVSTNQIPFSGTPDNFPAFVAVLNRPEPKLQPLCDQPHVLTEISAEKKMACQRVVFLCQQQEDCFRPSADAVYKEISQKSAYEVIRFVKLLLN